MPPPPTIRCTRPPHAHRSVWNISLGDLMANAPARTPQRRPRLPEPLKRACRTRRTAHGARRDSRVPLRPLALAPVQHPETSAAAATQPDASPPPHSTIQCASADPARRGLGIACSRRPTDGRGGRSAPLWHQRARAARPSRASALQPAVTSRGAAAGWLARARGAHGERAGTHHFADPSSNRAWHGPRGDVSVRGFGL
ncbi:hypothetical protein CERSUDRAFT_97603 [Gelatoporia subvermispora B]|uniref:Uncharacterized protein n=1 Tax=Ceriporiopsis subvermispora (strain B) TaxID=914234 RepID=M2QBH3_CERS8|nr:hypothetical protein CERSUDRAFT_97603 [Gelatoporia subvermispora B]